MCSTQLDQQKEKHNQHHDTLVCQRLRRSKCSFDCVLCRNSPTNSHRWRKKWCWACVAALSCIVGTAWQHYCACAVWFGCSPVVCVSGSVTLTAFQTFWACYSPAARQPVSSLSLHLLFRLFLLLACTSSLARSDSFSFSLSLWADEWSPGDEVTAAVTAQSLFSTLCFTTWLCSWPFYTNIT